MDGLGKPRPQSDDVPDNDYKALSVTCDSGRLLYLQLFVKFLICTLCIRC